MSVPLEQRTKSEQSWVPSVAFWLCLFVAAVLFAIPYLAPKLLRHARLSSRYHDNQARLATLSEHCEHLKIVQEALQSDPGFQAELARVEFDAVLIEDARTVFGFKDAPSVRHDVSLGQHGIEAFTRKRQFFFIDL